MKPCPFCGNKDTDIIDTTEYTYRVNCTECGASGPPAGNEFSAVNKWDGRYEG